MGKSSGNSFLFLVILGVGACDRALAQADYTANRDYSFSTFIAGATANTGFNTTHPAVIFGADATRHFKHFPLLTPSLELRVGLAPGKSVSERTFQGGLKLEHRIGRFHPYGEFLIGTGAIRYGSRFSDNSIVPAYGGGVDYSLSSRWSLKVDYSRQSWKTGTESPTFNPSTLSFGFVYHFNSGKE